MSPLLVLLALLGSTGCISKARMFDVQDQDDDGFLPIAAGGEDCDDADPLVHPGADERCNDADDDCDGEIDEQPADGEIFYSDTDADGHGDPGVKSVLCAAPAGWVEAGDDCDDLDPDVSPSATEQCNGMDDDCDGATDEAGDLVDWYSDADGDGYGIDDSATPSCSAPGDGWVTDGGDCDDDDATVSPGATESWYDGVDQDCSGGSDYDADGDGYDSDAYGGEDCDDDASAVSPAATEICEDGIDNDCDGGPGSCRWSGNVSISAEASFRFGGSVSCFAPRWAAADFDADGAIDLAVGTSCSVAYVLDGPLIGSGTSSAAVATVTINGGEIDALRAGDIDGDGTDELLVGCQSCGTEGSVFVYSMPTGSLDEDGADFRAYGGDTASGFGPAFLADRDLTGDGHADFFAFEGTYGSYSATRGPITGTFTTYSAEFSKEAVPELADITDASSVVVVGGNVDSDADTEILVAAPSDALGDAVIGRFEGPSWGSASVAALRDEAGEASALSACDTDADGIDEVIIGTTLGRAYHVADFVLSLDDYETWTFDTVYTGSTADEFGTYVACGDIDGDGYGDMVVAAPAADVYATNTGAIYLWFGPLPSIATSADATLYGPAASNAGAGVTTEDLDGDGYADLAIGAPGSGSVYILHGTGM